MKPKQNIKSMAEEIKDELIKWRRDFHRHPELGFEEERTSRIVTDKLKNWGYEVKHMAKTGVVGLLKEKKTEGKTLAIRVDMDALPLQEKNNVEYKSKYEGKMHACGHDGHTAIGLGAAKILAQLKDKIKGNIKFIFQPAEEGPGGAKPMIEEGVLQNPPVDAIIGLHIWSNMPLGKVGIGNGPIMASTDTYQLKIKGEGAHGAHPDEGVDPIVVSSHLILALQELVSRENSPNQPLVISNCSIHGGNTNNVIPDEINLEGTVRTLNEEVRDTVRTRIKDIIEGITTTFRADYELNYNRGYPVTINNPEINKLMEKTVQKTLGKDAIIRPESPSMGGEDFAFFLQEVPGAYIFLGTRNPEKNIIYPGHSPHFNIDESVLPIGVEIFVKAALDYLG